VVVAVAGILHEQILSKGVDVWNEWRAQHLSVIPDLSDCEFFDHLNLKRANLYRANLRGTRFVGTTLERAVLREADLTGCEFVRANLRKANLIEATFLGASLDDADLSGASADRADFSECDLRGANFSRAELRGAMFVGARFGLGYTPLDSRLMDYQLNGTCFLEAKLANSNFFQCHLGITPYALQNENLSELETCGISFERADLTSAKMSEAILCLYDNCALFPDFRQATMIAAQLDHACITGARLWESQRSGWAIQGIDCESAAWDREGEKKEHYQRGRFERAFATSHQILLEYTDGIEPVSFALLPLIIEELSRSHKRCIVSLKSVEDLGSRATVVISVLDAEGREDELFKQEYAILREKLHVAQRALSLESSLRQQAEAIVKYQETKIIPRLLETAMKQGKTINIGHVGGNFVDAERANYVEVGREAGLSTTQLRELAQYITANADAVRLELSETQFDKVLAASRVINQQVTRENPDKTALSEAADSLAKIAESAAGSLLATVIRTFIGLP
jgi:uncharacterized protein YjbI with pentapeptide repeats